MVIDYIIQQHNNKVYFIHTLYNTQCIKRNFPIHAAKMVFDLHESHFSCGYVP